MSSSDVPERDPGIPSGSSASVRGAGAPGSSEGGEAAAGEGQSIGAAFRSRIEAGGAALVPYVCAGYPDRRSSLDLLLAASDAGADVLELGVPFSDPLADGPTIQRASFRALEGGMTVRGALELLEEFRSVRETPVVLFTYLNPILRFGIDEFLERAVEVGAQGLLITDLPVGGDPELEATIRSGGLDPIPLASPTTPLERVERLSQAGRGFLYYISRTGVTGRGSTLSEELEGELAQVRRRSHLPVAVGFGIGSPEDVARVAPWSDGVVVGSALVEALDKEGVEGARSFLDRLVEAAHTSGR